MEQLPLLVLTEIFASASLQSAPTLIWLGPASGSWLVPANWSSPPVFDGAETFRFDGSSAGTPALLLGNFDVFRIENSVTNHDLASGGFIPRTLRREVRSAFLENGGERHDHLRLEWSEFAMVKPMRSDCSGMSEQSTPW